MNVTTLDVDFVKKVEADHFRTVHDTGANDCALFIWNLVRERLGLPRLEKKDLPHFCKTHKCYHVIKEDYGCVPDVDVTRAPGKA